MTTTLSHDEQKALFVNLVMMFSTTTLQQLGKLVNPATGKAEVDLQGAQFGIDMLDMLAARTQGHLDAEEERLLKQTLSTLQMNYFETAASAKAGGEPEKQTEDVPPEPPPAAASGGEAPKSASDGAKKEPRYRKTYE